MITPYDWQEGMGHRSEYVESRLKSGTPVLVISIEAGILAFTVRRHAHKIYEVYDRLLLGAIGQQSDVEQIRVSAIEFSHQEGYQRSEDDVTIQRVVNALSQPLKRAFGDFNTAPFVFRGLFAEVGDKPEHDAIFLLDYDGDFSMLSRRGYLAGDQDTADRLKASLGELDLDKIKLDAAVAALKKIWASALDPEGKRSFESLTENLYPEIALLARHPEGEERFKAL